MHKYYQQIKLLLLLLLHNINRMIIVFMLVATCFYVYSMPVLRVFFQMVRRLSYLIKTTVVYNHTQLRRSGLEYTHMRI